MVQSLFWNNILFALQVASPLVTILRLADGKKKPSMGYTDEAMDETKEAITKSLNQKKGTQGFFLNIIDKRWQVHFHHPLKKLGIFEPKVPLRTQKLRKTNKL